MPACASWSWILISSEARQWKAVSLLLLIINIWREKDESKRKKE
jgi:hypothetical protein